MRRYRSKRTFGHHAPVEIGQLREPVVFARAKKVPVTGTASFVETYHSFLKTHAAVDEGRLALDSGASSQNSDAQTQTAFMIRDEGFEITTNEFIIWGIKTYKVVGVQRHRGLVPYLEIVAIENGPVSETPFEEDTNLPVPATSERDNKEAENSFWD